MALQFRVKGLGLGVGESNILQDLKGTSATDLILDL